MSDEQKSSTAVVYAIAAIVSGILLWVMNHLPVWKPVFLLPSYGQVLWAIRMSFGVQIALNLVLMVYHPRALHHFVQTIFCVVSLVSLSCFLRVFPVDFSLHLGGWFNGFFRGVLIFALVATAIGGIVSLVRFLRSLCFTETEPQTTPPSGNLV